MPPSRSMLTDQAASPPAWTPSYHVQGCRRGESAIVVDVLILMRATRPQERRLNSRVFGGHNNINMAHSPFFSPLPNPLAVHTTRHN
jgi:hypothetical protein